MIEMEDWKEADLYFAADLARCLFDLDKEQAALRGRAAGDQLGIAALAVVHVAPALDAGGVEIIAADAQRLRAVLGGDGAGLGGHERCK